jgi:hypothetical protein
MTVHTTESDAAAGAVPHRHAHPAPPTAQLDRAPGAPFWVELLALPRWVRIGAAVVFGLGFLLAIGVPLATLTPLLFLGGCLGMHLFMGHDMSHGGHGANPDRASHSDAESEDPAGRDG